MSSRNSYLGGFMSFRTPDSIRPVDPALLEPARGCRSCGAVLRQSNPGPLCAPCTGHFDIPDAFVQLLEADGTLYTIETLAAQITGQHRSTRAKQRNAAIREEYESGRASKTELQEVYGLSRQHVDVILSGQQLHHTQEVRG